MTEQPEQNHSGERGDVHPTVALVDAEYAARTVPEAVTAAIRREDIPRATAMIRAGRRWAAVELLCDSLERQAALMGIDCSIRPNAG